MKTTLEMPDELYREVKARAALRGQTVTALITEALGSIVRKPARAPAVSKGKPRKRPSREERLQQWLKEENAFLAKMRGPVFGKSAVEDLIEGRR